MIKGTFRLKIPELFGRNFQIYILFLIQLFIVSGWRISIWVIFEPLKLHHRFDSIVRDAFRYEVSVFHFTFDDFPLPIEKSSCKKNFLLFLFLQRVCLSTEMQTDFGRGENSVRFLFIFLAKVYGKVVSSRMSFPVSYRFDSVLLAFTSFPF